MGLSRYRWRSGHWCGGSIVVKLLYVRATFPLMIVTSSQFCMGLDRLMADIVSMALNGWKHVLRVVGGSIPHPSYTWVLICTAVWWWMLRAGSAMQLGSVMFSMHLLMLVLLPVARVCHQGSLGESVTPVWDCDFSTQTTKALSSCWSSPYALSGPMNALSSSPWRGSATTMDTTPTPTFCAPLTRRRREWLGAIRGGVTGVPGLGWWVKRRALWMEVVSDREIEEHVRASHLCCWVHGLSWRSQGASFTPWTLQKGRAGRRPLSDDFHVGWCCVCWRCQWPRQGICWSENRSLDLGGRRDGLRLLWRYSGSSLLGWAWRAPALVPQWFSSSPSWLPVFQCWQSST